MTPDEFAINAKLAFAGLHPRGNEITTFLLSVSNSDWFKNVGKPHSRDFSIERVYSWQDAVERLPTLRPAISTAFESTYDYIYDHDLEDLSDKIEADICELFLKKEQCWNNTKSPGSLNLAFGMLAEWLARTSTSIWIDHAHARHFSTSVFGFFVEGHWPCGWAGNFPDGKLIVY